MANPMYIQRNGQQVEIKPAFSVRPMTKTIVVNRSRFLADDKSRRLVNSTEKVEIDGYEVTFYRGHSLFVLSLEELRRLGYTGPTPLLADTGNEGEAEQVMTIGPQVTDKAA